MQTEPIGKLRPQIWQHPGSIRRCSQAPRMLLDCTMPDVDQGSGGPCRTLLSDLENR